MYKRFSLDEIQSIQNDFLPHLQEIIKREIRNPRDQNLKSFLKLALAEGDEVYYYFRSDVVFWFSKTKEGVSFFDERDLMRFPNLKGCYSNLMQKKWQKTDKRRLNKF